MIQIRILLSKEKKKKNERVHKQEKNQLHNLKNAAKFEAWPSHIQIADTSFPVRRTRHHKRRLPRKNWVL
jgi:hypothetical protein